MKNIFPANPVFSLSEVGSPRLTETIYKNNNIVNEHLQLLISGVSLVFIVKKFKK